MDRFIEVDKLQHTIDEIYLKSNMDRFIEAVLLQPVRPPRYLKSNMDRFIADTDKYCHNANAKFKIQYG